METETVIKVGALRRDATGVTIEVRREDAGAETLSFPASSETPVERYYGSEVLVHSRKAVRMERFERGAVPLLFNHDWDRPIGMVQSGEIKDRRLVVDARLFDTDEARTVRRMIDGGLRNVSIGYRVHTFEQDPKSNEVRAIDWEPLEVSIVTVPADASVGVGRAGDEEQVSVRVVRADGQPAAAAASKGVHMDTKQEQPAAGQQAAPYVNVSSNMPEGFDPLASDRERTAAIRNLARGMQITDERTIQHWIVSGKTYNTIAEEALAIQKQRGEQAAAAGIGLTERERQRFSITRAINAIVTRKYGEAGFEFEVSKAAAQRAGRILNEMTFMVPTDITHTRVQVVGTGSLGGMIVGTDIGSFVDVLRNRSVAFRAGVRTLSGLVGALAIPRKTAGGTGAWLSETGTATASDFTLSQIVVSPKRFAAYQEYSKQLMLQSTPDIDMLVQQDLAGELGVKVDFGILWGSGANNPTGIRFTSGIGTANPTSGTNVNYADMIRFQSTVASANAMFESFTYLTTPAVAGILMGKPRFTNSDTPIWGGGILDGTLVGQRAMSTQQIGSGQILAGAFDQVLFCEWQGLEIEVNPTANFQADIVGVKASIYADVAVRYPQAFAVGTGITG